MKIEAETYQEKRRNISATAILALGEVADDYGMTTPELLRLCMEEYGRFLDDMAAEALGDGDA